MQVINSSMLSVPNTIISAVGHGSSYISQNPIVTTHYFPYQTTTNKLGLAFMRRSGTNPYTLTTTNYTPTTNIRPNCMVDASGFLFMTTGDTPSNNTYVPGVAWTRIDPFNAGAPTGAMYTKRFLMDGFSMSGPLLAVQHNVPSSTHTKITFFGRVSNGTFYIKKYQMAFNQVYTMTQTTGAQPIAVAQTPSLSAPGTYAGHRLYNATGDMVFLIAYRSISRDLPRILVVSGNDTTTTPVLRSFFLSHSQAAPTTNCSMTYGDIIGNPSVANEAFFVASYVDSVTQIGYLTLYKITDVFANTVTVTGIFWNLGANVSIRDVSVTLPHGNATAGNRIAVLGTIVSGTNAYPARFLHTLPSFTNGVAEVYTGVSVTANQGGFIPKYNREPTHLASTTPPLIVGGFRSTTTSLLAFASAV